MGLINALWGGCWIFGHRWRTYARYHLICEYCGKVK